MSKKSDNKIIPIITGVIGFFGGIAFVNNWLVLNKSFPQSKYLEVPFNPDAWGNVADWAMIIITAFTAYYLVKTFREQKKATDINYKNYLSTIKPIFTVDKEVEDYGEGQKQLFVVLTIKENPADNITINIIRDDYIPDYTPFEKPFSLYPNDSFFLAIQKDPQPYGTLFLTPVEIFSFTFEDKENTRYKQSVFLSQGNRWTISGSEIIPV